MKTAMQNYYKNLLVEKIEEKGGKVKSEEDIFENLHLLSTEVEKWGEKMRFLPIQIKKMVAFIIDPNYHIEYVVKKTDRYCEVEARFFWSGEETPSGIGFKKLYVDQIRRNDSITAEERESSLESSCRGCAASRAITDAGIGMEMCADIFDFDYEKEDVERALEAEGEPTPTTLPEPKPIKVTVKEVKKPTPPKTPVEEKVEEQTVAPTTAPTEEVKEEKAPVMENADISLDDAKKAIADMGSLAGNTLEAIAKSQPKNLVWLIKNNSAVSAEALALIKGTAELHPLLDKI